MDVFEFRDSLIGDYSEYVGSFMKVRDDRIRERVEANLSDGRLWPDPSIGLNPAFESGGLIDELVSEAAGLNYETALDPPPADPSLAYPESTRPAWAMSIEHDGES